MTERLSEALHLEAARVPAIQRQPGQVRRAAERHRRIRRGGAVAVAAVAATLAVASLVTGPWGNTARPAPADSPSPNVTGTRMFSLAAQPTLIDPDWDLLTWGDPHEVYRLSSPPKVLNRCAPDPRAYRSPTDAYGAAYRELDRGRQEHLTEYVMRYADEFTAAQAYADVWFHSLGCATPFGDSSQVLQQNWPRARGGLADEAFFFYRPSTESGGYYHVIAARDRNVVIFVVSTGWREVPIGTVQIALMRAIPNERGKCPKFSPVC